MGNEKLDEVRNSTLEYFHSLISIGYITEIMLDFSWMKLKSDEILILNNMVIILILNLVLRKSCA